MLHAAFQDVRLSEEESGTLESGATAKLKFTFEAEETFTFRLCVTNGRIIIYASSMPNPSSALYDQRDEISHIPSFPITCLTKIYYDLSRGVAGTNQGGGQTSINENNNFGRRKRRQISPGFATAIYITLEGQDDINEFKFNSSRGNVTFGKHSKIKS